MRQKYIFILPEKTEKELSKMADGTYLTTKQVAERFNVSIQTIHNWLRQQLIPCLIVGKTRRFALSDIQNFERKNRTDHE